MKRISISLFIICLFLSFAHRSQALPQGEGDTILCSKGDLQLSRGDVKTYEKVVAFVLDRALTTSERQQIRQIVVEGFEADPLRVTAEIRSLSWAIAEVEQLQDSQKRAEIRLRFRQQMIAYQALGKENPLVILVLERF